MTTQFFLLVSSASSPHSLYWLSCLLMSTFHCLLGLNSPKGRLSCFPGPLLWLLIKWGFSRFWESLYKSRKGWSRVGSFSLSGPSPALVVARWPTNIPPKNTLVLRPSRKRRGRGLLLTTIHCTFLPCYPGVLCFPNVAIRNGSFLYDWKECSASTRGPREMLVVGKLSR